jgi:hypothetical protein
MPRTKSKTFTVKSRFPFPTDMLRYDACHPIDTESASAISESLRQHHTGDAPAGGYTVRLRSDLPGAPTVGRWQSFMWTVVP